MSVDDSPLATDPADAGDVASSSSDPIAALKERIRDKLVAELEAVPRYMYEDDDIVQLNEQDTDKAAKLLFGNVFDVENEWDDNAGDYHYNQDVNAAKEKLSELLDNDFEDEIEAVAEQLGLEADELTEELREDDYFTPQEIDWSGHFTSHKYHGSVAAYADLDVYIGIEPTADMFAALHLLRIKPEDFLKAVQSKMIEDDADADNAREYELSEDEVESADGSLFDAYRARFEIQLARSEIRFGYCHEFSEPPVVDVGSLVEKILDDWSSPANLYVSLALDGSTVEDVSTPLCRMDSPNKETLNFRVTRGYITDEARSGAGSDTLEILAPFEVPRSAFRVNNESADRDMDGGLELAPRERAYAEMYKIAVLDDTIKKADRNDPKARKTVADAIAKVVNSLPAHALAHARQGLVVRNWGDETDKAVSRWINEIGTEIIDARESALARAGAQEMGRQLLTILHQVDTIDCVRDQAKWLIKNGADVNIGSENGFTPALLSAVRRDIDLLSALHEAGADLSIVRESRLSGLADNALSLALRSGAKGAQKSGEPSPFAAAEWLLEHGVSPISAPVLGSTDDLTAPHAAYLAMQSKDSGFFSRLLAANAERAEPEEQQRLVNGLFVRAVTGALVVPGAVLIEAGADLDREIVHVRGRSGKGLPEEVLEHIGQSSSILLEDTKQFRQMVQAARAKRSIEDVLQKVRSASRPS